MIDTLAQLGLVHHDFPQNSDAWYAARRGVMTGSRASDMRSRSDGLTTQQRTYVDALRKGLDEGVDEDDAVGAALATAGYKNKPRFDALAPALAGTLTMEWSDGAKSYAMDVARELEGGTVPVIYQGGVLKIGHEEEPFGATAYEAKTDRVVELVGFITTTDLRFGCSIDRLVAGVRAAIEIKTMVGSTTLFKAVVDGNVAEYRDQCLFALWLLSLEWIDLCLWSPDLNHLCVVRITRDEDEIQALEDDVMAFAKLVDTYRAALRRALGRDAALAAALPVSAAAATKTKAAPARAAVPTEAF